MAVVAATAFYASRAGIVVTDLFPGAFVVNHGAGCYLDVECVYKLYLVIFETNW